MWLVCWMWLDVVSKWLDVFGFGWIWLACGWMWLDVVSIWLDVVGCGWMWLINGWMWLDIRMDVVDKWLAGVRWNGMRVRSEPASSVRTRKP